MYIAFNLKKLNRTDIEIQMLLQILLVIVKNYRLYAGVMTIFVSDEDFWILSYQRVNF